MTDDGRNPWPDGTTLAAWWEAERALRGLVAALRAAVPRCLPGR